jgi:hypothetical protein
MASVWLGGGPVDLPPVCVKTGPAAALVGLASSALAAATGAAEPAALLLFGVVGGVGLLVNEWVNWFGVRLSPDGSSG